MANAPGPISYPSVLWSHWWRRVTAAINAASLLVGFAASDFAEWPIQFLFAGLLLSVLVAQWSAWRESATRLAKSQQRPEFSVDLQPVNDLRKGQWWLDNGRVWNGWVIPLTIENTAEMRANLRVKLQWRAGNGSVLPSLNSSPACWHSSPAPNGWANLSPRDPEQIDAVFFGAVSAAINAWGREEAGGFAWLVVEASPDATATVVPQMHHRPVPDDLLVRVTVEHEDYPEGDAVYHQDFTVEVVAVATDPEFRFEPRLVKVPAEQIST